MGPIATNDRPSTSAAAPFAPPNPAVAEFSRECQINSGPKATPRAKEVLDSLMAHMHAFIDEVQLTPEEWLLACNELAKAGKVTDEKRNEFILISDILGIESLVDTLAHQRARKEAKAKDGNGSALEPTSSAILGPFFREGAPRLPMGADIVKDHSTRDANGKGGQTAYMYGTVADVDGTPIEGAEIDVWHDAVNGLYEQQDPNQPEYNCRGKFVTGKDGRYGFRCLRPVAYPIPYDSTTGDMLTALDRSPMRPSHIHLYIRTLRFQPLITQIFDRGCPYLGSDSVFATKDDLVVEFAPAKCAEAKDAQWELSYDVCLAPVI